MRYMSILTSEQELKESLCSTMFFLCLETSNVSHRGFSAGWGPRGIRISSRVADSRGWSCNLSEKEIYDAINHGHCGGVICYQNIT